MELVNGIPCFSCADVERAKKLGYGGTAADPLHRSPAIGPVNPPGAIAPLDAAEDRTNRPLTSGDRGTKINFAV